MRPVVSDFVSTVRFCLLPRNVFQKISRLTGEHPADLLEVEGAGAVFPDEVGGPGEAE